MHVVSQSLLCLAWLRSFSDCSTPRQEHRRSRASCSVRGQSTLGGNRTSRAFVGRKRRDGLPQVSATEIVRVDVCAQPRVVNEIPADMVWIVVDDDRVAVPQPVIHQAVVVRSNAKVEAVEKESAAVPAPKMKQMVPAKPAGKAPVFERVIEMIVGIVAARVVPDPPLAVDMRPTRVVRRVVKAAALATSDARRPRTVCRYVAPTKLMTASGVCATAAMLATAATALRVDRHRGDQRRRNKTSECFHSAPLC